MKTVIALTLIAATASYALADKKPEPAVPVVTNPATPVPAAPVEGGDYQQRLYGPGASLIAPEKATEVVSAFKVAHDKLGKPRVLVYVNRELVDENSGLKLTGRKESTETLHTEKKSSFEADPNAAKPAAAPSQTQVNVAVNGNVGNGTADTPGKGSAESRTAKVTGENTYGAADKAAPTLADRQTVRDVERLIGRPLRSAGVALADQKVAASLIADRSLDHFTTPTNESARKDREALAKVTDVVIEALISSRNITVRDVSGDRTVQVPDIQLTAIRLSDSAILGQATASDVLGKDQQAGRVARQYDIRDITEATALALMEDITLTAK